MHIIKNIIKLTALFFCLITYTQPPKLTNCGNSCYINSFIQAFYGLKPLTEYLLANDFEKSYSDTSIIPPYIQLIKKIAQHESSHDQLSIFVEYARKLMENVTGQAIGGQEDTSEFMAQFISALKNTENNDILGKIELLFDIGIVQKVICPTLKDFGIEIDPSYSFESYLPLPVRGHIFEDFYDNYTTLNDCLHNYFNSTLADPANYYNFEGNVLPDCNVVKAVTKGPEILIVVLQRFKTTELGKPVEKLSHTIRIPLSVDLLYYSAAYLKNPGDAYLSQDFKYTLVAAIKHVGNEAQAGHYIAYVFDQETQNWYLCDDATITPKTETEVQKEIEDGYIYFYQKNQTSF